MIAVAAGRTHLVSCTNAPTANHIGRLADTKNADFVVRYYPSKKAWMVTDARERRKFMLSGGRRVVWDAKSMPRLDRLFPHEDAAVMWAMMQCGVQPETT